MWRACKIWLVALLAMATLLMTCLVTIRHRHTGELAHSHGRSHSHVHSHGGHSHSHGGHSHTHGHSHSHAEEPEDQLHGWHLHVLLLGWEITFWEGGVQVVKAPPGDEPVAGDRPEGTTIASGLQLLTSDGPGWCLLGFFFPLLRSTGRPRRSAGLGLATALRERALRAAQRHDRPPVPPPRWITT